MYYYMFQSQAQECVYEKLTIGGITQGILEYCLMAQEASMVTNVIHVLENRGVSVKCCRCVSVTS